MLNRTRTSTLDAFGLRDQRNRIYPALTGSDGSTLSLDFTAMSRLDSRFTFSRSSPATFINSSGLVRYADHNLFLNTAWLTSTTPTTWNVAFGTGTTTWNNNGTVTMTAGGSSVRPFINFQTTTVAQGLPMTFGYLATNVTGSPAVGDIISSTGVGDTFAINGVTVASSAVVSSGDVVSCTFSPASGSIPVRLGPGCQVGVTNMSVTASRPQWNYGTTLQQYQQNTSTSAQLHSPRFDYDPSTLAPRGLLLEGSATNLLKYSQGLFTNWLSAGTVGAVTTGITSPSGDSSAVSLNLNTAGNNGYYTNNTLMGYTNTVGATYTFSIWVRATGSTTNLNIRLGDSAVGYSANIPITTSWQRLQYSYVAVSASGPVIASATSTATGVVELWGAQLEAGSGASSYIPTGASTVQRAADSCQLTGTNFSSWFNAGAAYSMLFRYSLNNPTAWAGTNIDRACGQLSVSGSGNRTFINAAYRVASGSGDIGRYVRIFDLGTLDMQPATLPAAASNTALAFAVNTNDAAVSAANQSLGTDSACTILTGQNQLDIGHVGSAQYINGCISLIKYWPQRLSNAQLQALTA